MKGFKILANGQHEVVQDALFAAGYAYKGTSKEKYHWCTTAIGYSANADGCILAFIDDEWFNKSEYEEYVLQDGKLVPINEATPVVIDASVVPDAVREAVREVLADKLRQAATELETGDDPPVEHWQTIFELQEFLTKP